MATLDAVMVAITAGGVSPMVVGDVYCSVLEACHEVFDLRRAREWTGALSRFCEGQDDLVAYRGPCMVHRAELMQLHGAWTDAFHEARRACEWIASPVSPEGPGEAFYRLAELHRLRGDYPDAEEAYRQATRLGRRPEPGLPLLWLAQGRAEAARIAISRALVEAEATDLARRATLLDAEVQAAIACNDGPAGRAAADAMRDITTILDAPYLRALAGTAAGAVSLAEREPGAALGPLRRAWTEWQRLEAPYESARVRVLIGTAYCELGDFESAAMELDAARWVFQQLGAIPDLLRVDAMTARTLGRGIPGGLSPREVEVLRLVAAGSTNREIAAALVISEHTVARHIQNMLAKLGRPSRTALAAFAIKNGLAGPRDGQS